MYLFTYSRTTEAFSAFILEAIVQLRSWSTLAMIIATISGNGIAQTTVGPQQTQGIDRIFEKWNRPGSPGCAVAVMQNGQIIYKHGYGMADLEHGARITPSTPFHVASVSKQFTAAAIVLLAQAGKVSVDDDVRKYIPELPDYDWHITLRNLLHHTSGLRDQWDLLDLAGWRYSLDLITNQDVLDVVTRQKELNFPPGDRFLYSNTGFTLLGEIVKRVSGKSLREFTSERIFGPLGMSRTHFRDDHAELIKGEAYGYAPAQKSGWRLSGTNFSTVGATSLFTTVEDLSRWDENFYQPRVGGPHFREQMLHRDKLNNGQLWNYAFGLILGSYRGLPTVEHAGEDAGYRAILIRFPDQHFSIACLCNAGPDASPGLLAREVADRFLANQYRESPPPSKFPELPEQQLQQLAGSYWDPKTDWVGIITLKKGSRQLILRPDPVPLQPIAPDVFRVPDSGVDIHFTMPNGKNPVRAQATSEYSMPQTFEMLPSFTLQPDVIPEYLGSYRSDEIEPIYNLISDQGTLILRRLKHGPEVLEAVAPDLFVTDLGTVRFFRNSQHRVAGMLLSTDRVYKLRLTKEATETPNVRAGGPSGAQ